MWKRLRKFINRRLLSNARVNENQFGLWFLFFVSVLAAYTSLLTGHGIHLWRRDYFQFYPVFVVGVVFLTVQRFRSGALPPRRVWRIEPVSLAVGLTLLPFALWIASPWTAALSFLLVGNALLCANRQARQSWRLLALLIPLPLGRDRLLVQKLQQISSAKAGVLLDTFSVPHRMHGNVLELTDRHFFVEEACSGISSVYLMLAATCFCLVWYQTRAVRAIPLLLSVFWWAVVANILRIFSIAAAHHYWGIDLSTGIFHELTGIAVLGFAFGMVYLTMQFLDFLFAPIGDGTAIRDNKVSMELTPTVLWNLFTVNDLGVAHGARPKPPLGLNVHRRVLLYSLSVFLFVSVTVNLTMAYAPRGQDADKLSNVPLLTDNADGSVGLVIQAALDADLFAEHPGVHFGAFENKVWKLVSDQEAFGRSSSVWISNTGSTETRLSLDGPFIGWHNLAHSYGNRGWKVVNVKPLPIRPTADDNQMALQLMDAEGRSATLYFCCFQPNGQLIGLPDDFESGGLVDGVRGRLKATSSDPSVSETWQIQMLVMQSGHVIESQVDAERELFEQLVWTLLKRWRQLQ